MELQQNEAKRAQCDATQKSEFMFNGAYIHDVEYSGQDVEGVTYTRDVKRNIRDRISKSDFVALNSMLHDTRNSTNLQNTERVKMHDGRYLSMNVPVLHSICSYLEVFHHLFHLLLPPSLSKQNVQFLRLLALSNGDDKITDSSRDSNP